MGPVILCDKSTIQSLSKSALERLHHYFSVNIPPVLVIEIMSDLKKGTDQREAERDVRTLASKVTFLSAMVNTDYRALLELDLSETSVCMDGRPVLIGATKVVAETGEIGAKIADDPYELALERWRDGEFDAGERLLAEIWRTYSAALQNDVPYSRLERAYSPTMRPKRTLGETLEFVDDLVAATDQCYLLDWLFEYCAFSKRKAEKLLRLAKALPTRSLAEGSYAQHCVRAALLGYFSMKFGLTSKRPTNRIDLEYLFYLPFCDGFSAWDRFPRALAPLLLREDQVAVNTDALAADLRRIAKWIEEMNADDRQAEMQRRGPPEHAGSTCHDLWQRFIGRDYRSRPQLQLSDQAKQKLMSDVLKLTGASESSDPDGIRSLDDCDYVFRRRRILVTDPCPCNSGKAYKDCHGLTASP